MPELPEVETIARGLRRQILEQNILTAELRTPSVWRFGALARVEGQRVVQVSRRAKLLRIDLDNDHALLFHLKMTGRVWLTGAETPRPKHTHAVFDLEGNDTLLFEDPRRFGLCGCLSHKDLCTWPFYAQLGPEPLETAPVRLAQRLGRRAAGIKSLLLNQTVIAGIGNIYADESLFAARIHPASRATNIPSSRLATLCTELQRILLEAIAAGGSTISDYRNAYGQHGLFQNSFQVYGKKGQPCPACGARLQVKTIAGRTSTHCSRCQRLY